MKKYLMAIAVLAVVICSSGCIDTGSVNNTDSNQSQVTIPLTNKIVLNITDSNRSPEIYAAGDKVNITFTPSNESFTVSNKRGTFNGQYNVSGNVLTLKFPDSVWVLTFFGDGTFTGVEGNASDTGTYEWI